MGWHTERMRDNDAAMEEPTAPDYGTPTGADARLPLYGSSDSVVPIEHAVADVDPKAEQRKKARAARAAAAERTERARRAKKKAKAEAAARANRANREAMLARTRDVHAAAARRRGERAVRSYAAPPARLVAFSEERRRRLDKAEAERRQARAVAGRRARITGAIVVAVLVVGGITTAIVVGAGSERTAVSESGLDWSGYPGYDGTEYEDVTEGRSQEEITAADTAMLEEIRATITDEAGLDWQRYGSELVIPQKNAWDGQSLLNNWNSSRWYSTDALPGVSEKRAVVERVSTILEENGFESIGLANDPETFGGDDELLRRLYGGTTLETQVVWVLDANRFDGSFSSFELRITDLTHDVDGDFAERAKGREAIGIIPVNSIVIEAKGYQLLPADERDEYIARAEPFEGEDPPPAR